MATDIVTSIPIQDINELDPRKKGKEFCTKYAKATYFAYKSGSASNFYSQKAQWALNRKYALGKQPIDIYKKMMGRDENVNYDSLYWVVPMVIPKIIDILIGIVTRIKIQPSCDAVDPDSYDAKLQKRYKQEVEVLLKDEIAQLEKMAGFNLKDPNNTYDDLEELEIDYQTGNFKTDLEIAMEELIDVVLNYNNLEEIKIQLARDMVECGMGVLKHYVRADGLLVTRRVDPMNFISDFVSTRDFKDMSRCGEFRVVSLSELKRLAGNEFTEEQYFEIAKSVEGKYANAYLPNYGYDYASYQLTGGGYIYDKWRVAYFDCEFTTTDRIVTLTKKNKFGNEETRKEYVGYEAKASEENRKFIKNTDYTIWYKCKWIIDTEYSWDYGKLEFPNVKANQLNESKSSFAVCALHMDNMLTAPVMDRCIPFIDQIVLNWMQMQSFIAKAIPHGIAANSYLLSNVPNGKGGTFDPLELLTRYTQTGNMMGGGLDPSGRPILELPIQELTGTDLSRVNIFWNNIVQNIDMIRQCFGLNDVTDASNPNPEQSVGGAKLALQGTTNSMQPLITAISNIIERTSEGIINRAQHLAANGELNYMANAIGMSNIKALAISSDVSVAQFGIKIIPMPDESELVHLEQNIQAALNTRAATGKGGIELIDALKIRRYKHIPKMAEKYLAYALKKRRKLDMEESQQMQEGNAMVSERQAQAQTQSKQQIMAAEVELYQKKAEIDVWKEKQIYDFKMAQDTNRIKQEAEKDAHLSILDNGLNGLTNNTTQTK